MFMVCGVGEAYAQKQIDVISGGSETGTVDSGAADASDRNDWYSFTISAARKLELVLRNLTADADLCLYSSSIMLQAVETEGECHNNLGYQGLIASSTEGSSSTDRVTWDLQPGGYYVRVDGYRGGRTGYTLDYNTEAPPEFRLSVMEMTISEGAANEYMVSLTSAPSNVVSVSVESDNRDVTVSPSQFSFTPSSWEQKAITVSAVEDDDSATDTATLSHRVSGLLLGSEETTDGGTVTVTVTDDTPTPTDDTPTPGVTLRPTSLDVSEGGSGAYTVALRSRPSGDVIVTAASDNGDVTVSPETLTFTPQNWSTAQSVVVAVKRDDDGEDETATVSHAVSGYGSVTDGGAVRVRIADTYSTGPDAAEKEAVEAVVEGAVAGSVANVTANIGARFSSAPGGGATLSLGGRTVTLGEAASALAGLDADAGRAARAKSGGESWSRGLSAEEMWRSSAFELSLGADEGGTGIGWPSQWTLWGRGDLLFFDKKPDTGPRYDSELLAGYLGIDGWLNGRWLVGLAASRTGVESDYQRAGAQGDDGRLEMTMTGIHPYARFAPDAESELWVVLGAGRGEIENRRQGASAREKSDATMYMAAVGGRRALPTDGDVDVALLGDVGFGKVTTDSGQRRQTIDALSIDSQRVRLGVEGSRTTALEGEASLTPFAEVAGRYDGGGDSEFGIEVAGGLYYADPASGLGVEARGRAMALHSGDYREYGASLTASLSPGAGGEGLSLSLSPRLGAPTGGADTLWRDDALGFAASSDVNREMSLGGRIGYGFRAAAVNGVLTPFGELALREGDSRQLRTGMRFDRTGPASGTLSLELSGERLEDDDVEHRMGLTGRLRF